MSPQSPDVASCPDVSVSGAEPDSPNPSSPQPPRPGRTSLRAGLGRIWPGRCRPRRPRCLCHRGRVRQVALLHHPCGRRAPGAAAVRRGRAGGNPSCFHPTAFPWPASSRDSPWSTHPSRPPTPASFWWLSPLARTLGLGKAELSGFSLKNRRGGRARRSPVFWRRWSPALDPASLRSLSTCHFYPGQNGTATVTAVPHPHPHPGPTYRLPRSDSPCRGLASLAERTWFFGDS